MLILPHIAFEGLNHDDACVKDKNFILITAAQLTTAFAGDATKLAEAKEVLSKPVVDMEEVAKAFEGVNLPEAADQFPQEFRKAIKDGKFNRDQDVFMRKIYRGYSATASDGKTTMTSNAGHLGAVDSLEYCNRVWGTAGGQIYKARKN